MQTDTTLPRQERHINQPLSSTIRRDFHRAEDIISAKTDLEKNETDCKTEAEREACLKEMLKVQEGKLPKVRELTEKIAEIKAILPDYDEL